LRAYGGAGGDRDFTMSSAPSELRVASEEALINSNLGAINRFLPPPQDFSAGKVATTEMEKQNLAEYQKSLLVLTCGNPRRLMMSRNEGPTSQSELTETATETTNAAFQSEGAMDFANSMSSNDVLQDFDFDSFLHQDGEPMDFTFSTSEFLDGLAQSERGSSNNKPRAGGPTTSIADSAPISSAPNKEDPLFVNKKQFHRILKRRAARQKLEEKLKSQRSRPHKPYLHSSPPALRRVTGPGGLFLTQEMVAEQEKKKQEELESQTPITQVIMNEPADANLTAEKVSKPDHFLYQDDQPHSFKSAAASLGELDLTLLARSPGFSLGLQTQTELASTYPALSHSQLSKLWWQAYAAVHHTQPISFRLVAEELRSELGLFAMEYFPDDLICKRISTNIKRIGTALHNDKLEVDGIMEILEMRGNSIRIMTTVEMQLGLEVATLGWGCVWTFFAVSFPFLTGSRVRVLTSVV
jgi:hypothetical protein